jgi:predicted short-subunit dehydrogenase-like oxidoreductase (DUF2520 family)
VVHCSGVLSAGEALAPLLGRAREIGRMHPLVSVADRGASFQGAVFAVEGETAEELARRLGGQPVWITGAAMPLYHAAAVLAAGHVVALLDLAVELAGEAGLPEEAARAGLGALATGAIANAQRLGTAEGLTGPIARGDADAVERHLKAIPAGARPIYLALARRSVELARRRAAADPAALAQVEKLLAEPKRPTRG